MDRNAFCGAWQSQNPHRGIGYAAMFTAQANGHVSASLWSRGANKALQQEGAIYYDCGITFTTWLFIMVGGVSSAAET